ncbi:hypothetical protein B0H11DRAFT_819068 [Mycena galericulata]|nr:hypothetical protein B0H11DRAFT_819068 [Mycena galericulata]
MASRMLFVSLLPVWHLLSIHSLLAPASSVTPGGGNTGFGAFPIPRNEAPPPHSSDAFAHHRTYAYASDSHTPVRNPDNSITVGPLSLVLRNLYQVPLKRLHSSPCRPLELLLVHRNLVSNTDLSPL